MPFKSERQKRFLYATKPDVAKKFADHPKPAPKPAKPKPRRPKKGRS